MSRQKAPSRTDSQKQGGFFRTIATNRRATFDYEILETYEAGLVLWGTEIKSIRSGQVDLRGAYAHPQDSELWLHGMHVSPYAQGNVHNHEPLRPRKLLLHRKEMEALMGRAAQRGLTIVPLRLYIKGRVAKVALGLARGKRRYQKKQALIDRAVERDIQRALRQR